MPRTCRACSSPDRTSIEKAIVSGEPLREIAEKSRVSISALHRHKTHVSQAIARASEKREESIGVSIMARLETLYRRTEKILTDAEQSGDGRLALQAVRESRENLGGLFALASKATGGGLSEVPDTELTSEVKRRALGTLVRVEIVNVGGSADASTSHAPSPDVAKNALDG